MDEKLAMNNNDEAAENPTSSSSNGKTMVLLVAVLFMCSLVFLSMPKTSPHQRPSNGKSILTESEREEINRNTQETPTTVIVNNIIDTSSPSSSVGSSSSDSTSSSSSSPQKTPSPVTLAPFSSSSQNTEDNVPLSTAAAAAVGAGVVSNTVGGTGEEDDVPTTTPLPFLMGSSPNFEAVDHSLLEFKDKPHARKGWGRRLYTPTFVAEMLGFWWIVDCWHHRVLYRKRLPEETDADLDAVKNFDKGWKKLRVPDESYLRIPHSMATDGKIVVLESSIGGSGNATNHSILVFEFVGDETASSKNDVKKKEETLKATDNSKNSSSSSSSDPATVEAEAELAKKLEIEIPQEVLNHPSQGNVSHPASNWYGKPSSDDDFKLIQILRVCNPVGSARRPHRILYDSGIDAFFLYITDPGSLARFDKQEPNSKTNRKLKLTFCTPLKFMRGGYARSIAFFDSDMIVSLGPNVVSRFSHRSLKPDTVDIPLRKVYYAKSWRTMRSSMNDIQYLNGYWYITQTRECRFFRVRRLAPQRLTYAKQKKNPDYKVESFKNYVPICRPRYKRGTDQCTGGGFPYFVSQIGNRIYLPYIFGCSGVVSFALNTNSSQPELPVVDTKHHFDPMGWTETQEDLRQRGNKW